MLKRILMIAAAILLLLPYSAAQEASPLLYALPSAYARYHRQQQTWFLDCAVSRKCVVNFEVYQKGQSRAAASVRKRIDNSGIFRIAWNGKNGERRLAPGRYSCRVYAVGYEEQAFVFQLDIREGRPQELPVTPNGSLLPDGDIWQCMMQPITVVDIDAEAHQKIYLEPDPQSRVMGHVHGQSQGLEVLESGARYTRVRAWRHEDNAPVEGYIPTKKLKVVYPNTHYGLWVDKSAQTLTVYEYGQPIGRARISTGLPAQEKAFRETRTGAFITTDRLMPFESGGYWCEYPIRFDGGNLFHQIGCIRKGNEKDFSHQKAQLGQKASEGCVRFRRQAGRDMK